MTKVSEIKLNDNGHNQETDLNYYIKKNWYKICKKKRAKIKKILKFMIRLLNKN